MILVSGAGGKTGRAIIRALAAKGEAVRAFVRREEHVSVVKASGAREAVVGDVRDGEALSRAMDGARAAYHICPNVDPEEERIGELVIGAARAAGVQHFVFHSVLHPQAEAMPHHWSKLRVEELLFESGLPCAILQPTAYMQNILAGWESITQRGVFTAPYPAETRLSLVDLHDVAEAAAIVLTDPTHAGATYELVGTPPMSQTEVAASLSRGLGRAVRAESESIQSWEQRSRAAGLGEYQIDTLIKMFRYYERHGLHGNPNTLRWLLARPPTTFDQFVEQTRVELK
ncbi:MAG: NAD-dependent epimerase/dehydratase family protein [Chloroflexi bacterium]|nr:NAD-dependent epimerase/dehydratase family protein [Chloroflexota bacterium]